MTQGFKGGIAGFVLAIGLLLGIGSGGAQPAEDRPLLTDTVERELLLLRQGLFREQSGLPLDAARSIEQVLEDQMRAIARLESRLTAFDMNQLNGIERRVASFEQSLNALDTTGLGDLERELQAVRRSIEELDRTVGNIPRGSHSSVQRSLDQLERELNGDTARAIDSLQYDVRGLKSSLRSVEEKVQTLERKIP